MVVAHRRSNVPRLAAALIPLVCEVVRVGAQRSAIVVGTVSDFPGDAMAGLEATVLGAGVRTLTAEHPA